MWILEGLGSLKGQQRWLRPNSEYRLGRKELDILIDDDKTVGRHHVVFKVKSCGTMLDVPTQVEVVPIVTDTNKIPFTKINTKILGEDTYVLQDGDILQFGTRQTQFKANHINFFVTVDKMNNGTLNELKTRFSKLDWKILEGSWNKNQSTHLWVDEKKIRMGILTMQCLVSNGHFISETYLRKLESSISDIEKDFTKMPDPMVFFPEIKDIPDGFTNDIWLPNAKRKDIFYGMHFIFTDTESLDLYGPIVACGGGKVEELNHLDFRNEIRLVKKIQSYGDCVIVTKEGTETRRIVNKVLKTLGLRDINYKEIYYAIFSASTEKYCNPSAPRSFKENEIADPVTKTRKLNPVSLEMPIESPHPNPIIFETPKITKITKIKTEITESERQRKRKRAENATADLMALLLGDPTSSEKDIQQIEENRINEETLIHDSHLPEIPVEILPNSSTNQLEISTLPDPTGSYLPAPTTLDSEPPKKQRKIELNSKQDLLDALKRNPVLIKNNDIETDDVDDATTHMKNLMIIKPYEYSQTRDNSISPETFNYNGIPNFKRFKKMQPMIPLGQHTYIKLVKHVSGNGYRDVTPMTDRSIQETQKRSISDEDTMTRKRSRVRKSVYYDEDEEMREFAFD